MKARLNEVQDQDWSAAGHRDKISNSDGKPSLQKECASVKAPIHPNRNTLQRLFFSPECGRPHLVAKNTAHAVATFAQLRATNSLENGPRFAKRGSISIYRCEIIDAPKIASLSEGDF